MTANGSTDNKWIGKRTIRPDGVEKVTGRAAFGADFAQPGMLFGKVLRSPHPHARIKAINFAKAQALPGVKAVMCGRDLVDFPWHTPVILGIQDLRFISRNVMARDRAFMLAMRWRRLPPPRQASPPRRHQAHRGRLRGPALGDRRR